MGWKFDKTPPANIAVEFEGGSFALMHRRLKASEKLAVQESFSANMTATAIAGGRGSESLGLVRATEILWSAITGWEGVEDASGNPLPFEYEENGRKRSNLDAVMGMIPTRALYRAIFAQIGMNGISVDRQAILFFVGSLDEEGLLEELEETLALFLGRPKKMAGGSSRNSAGGETPTAPSGS